MLRIALLAGTPTLLIGGTGVGKTMAVFQMAYQASMNGDGKSEYPVPHMLPVPVMRVQCAKEDTRYELTGHETVTGGNVEFHEGPIPMAIRLANERGLAILLLDEINTLPAEGQKVLNPLLEDGRSVFYNGRKWSLNPEARLIIIGTMNPVAAGYGGIRPLNQDLSRRFVNKLVIGYPKKTEEGVILSHFTKDRELIDKLLLLAAHTRGESIQGSERLEYSIPLGTGDLVSFIKSYQGIANTIGNEGAMSAEGYALDLVIVAKYEGPEREAISAKIKDIWKDDPFAKNDGLRQSDKPV